MNKHANLIQAIDNLTDRTLQAAAAIENLEGGSHLAGLILKIADDMELTKEFIKTSSTNARIRITEEEREILNHNGEKPFSGSEF